MSTDLARELVNAVLAAVEHADDGNAPNRVAEAALAAAEERGRRSGVEEAADLYEELAGTSDEARHIGMRLHGLAPLVPRDSGKVEVCRAEVASRMPDYSHYECTLPKGHSGAHREGGAEWTDKDTVIA